MLSFLQITKKCDKLLDKQKSRGIMKNLFNRINIISCIILVVLLAATFVVCCILDYFAFDTHEGSNNTIMYLVSAGSIMLGIIYILFACYSLCFYKDGQETLAIGLIAVVLGNVSIIAASEGIYLRIPPLKYILIATLIYTLFREIKTVIVLIDSEGDLRKKEEQLRIQVNMNKIIQIKAHFIFNVLNAISGMCKYNPQKADEAIVRFSRLLRVNMDIVEHDKLAPFDEVIENLENYLEIEKIRFGEKFIFKKEIQFSDFRFPMLILQPLVENSIRHGIAPKEGRGIIWLKSYEEDDYIYIVVEDDGIGFDYDSIKNKESIGINNIKYRLKYTIDGSLDIKSKPDVGTIATIRIPRGGGRAINAYYICR